MAKSRRLRASRRRRRPKPAPALLILECDPESLPVQPHTFARDLRTAVSAFVPGALAGHVQGSSKQEVLADFGRWKTEHGRIDMIAVVGHSNLTGIRVAPDLELAWDAFAQWVKPFAPRTLVLVACEAGREVPARALFGGIPTLKELYASPVLINDLQAAVIKILVPYLLTGRRLSPRARTVGQFLNFLITQGIIWYRRRSDFRRRPSVLDTAAVTIAEELVKRAHHELGRVIRS